MNSCQIFARELDRAALGAPGARRALERQAADCRECAVRLPELDLLPAGLALAFRAEPATPSPRAAYYEAVESPIGRLHVATGEDGRVRLISFRRSEESFVEEIAPARTFGFLKEVEMLRQRGLALGGSLDNAIVLGETGVLNNALRFVVGHLVAHRGGHALHTAFAAKILEESDAWRLVEAPADPAVVSIPSAAAAKPAARLAN